MANCNCNNCNSNVATIIATLAAGDSTSPYYVMANVTKRLCKSCCTAKVPVFAPSFAVTDWNAVGTGQYVATVQCQGCITYNPCGTCCCSETEPVSQTFTIPFSSATAPTAVTVASGATINAIAVSGCQTCGKTFVSETPLTLTVTTA